MHPREMAYSVWVTSFVLDKGSKKACGYFTDLTGLKELSILGAGAGQKWRTPELRMSFDVHKPVYIQEGPNGGSILLL